MNGQDWCRVCTIVFVAIHMGIGWRAKTQQHQPPQDLGPFDGLSDHVKRFMASGDVSTHLDRNNHHVLFVHINGSIQLNFIVENEEWQKC